MSTFPSIIEQGRGKYLILVVLTALLQAAAAGIAAVATRDVFAMFLAPPGPLPVLAFAILVTSGIVIAAGRVAQSTVAERLGQSFAGDLRERLFVHLSRMPRITVQNQRRGGLSLRFVGDLTAIRGWVGDAMPKLIAAGLVLPTACAAGFVLHPLLGAALTGCMCIGIAAMAFCARLLRPLHRALRRKRARLSADMSERAPQAPDLRLIGRTDLEREHLRTHTRALTEVATARRRAGAIMRAIPDGIAAIAGTLILVIALHLDLGASLAAGALAAAAILVAPLRDLAMIWDRYNAYFVARSKCQRVFLKPVLPEATAVSAQPSVTFKAVSHGPLRSVCFEVPAGGALLVSGPNGSGKSTLLRLAAGLEEPEEGHVQIGTDPASVAAPGAEVCLFDVHTPILAGSLRRSLTLGARERPSDESILTTAKAFGLAPLLKRLGGLDGHVVEFGRNLSDGERWRVLLARACLTKARLVLLDCPDRALDRNCLSTAVQRLTSERTTLIMTASQHGDDFLGAQAQMLRLGPAKVGED